MAASEEHIPSVSVVIPVCNEEENLRPLYACLNGALECQGKDYEVIFIDDGSLDGSRELLQDLAKQDKRVRVVTLRTNLGKSMALAVGFRQSRGEIIITMDADLQDDPKEIPAFLKAIEGGYDLVSGWRKTRRDPWAKIVLSRIYNWATRMVTGVPLHDFNCGFKAYRRDLLSSLRVYGELHRYIPVLAAWRGYRIAELAVQHHPRRAGRSKYGTARIPRGFLDLLTIVFLTRYDKRPLHFLGGTGILMLLLGLGINLYMTFLWLGNRPIGNRPLLFLGILLLLVGVQFVFFGLLAEFLLYLHLRADDRYLDDAIALRKRDGGDTPPG